MPVPTFFFFKKGDKSYFISGLECTGADGSGLNATEMHARHSLQIKVALLRLICNSLALFPAIYFP